MIAIGAAVMCSDGPCGKVRCVVLDPVAREVTHIVIASKHRHVLGRLVPLALVTVAGDQVTLRCDLAAFQNLEVAEQAQFMPRNVGYATYKPQDTLTLPYYGLGLAAVTAADDPALIVTHDPVPVGGVRIHEGTASMQLMAKSERSKASSSNVCPIM